MIHLSYLPEGSQGFKEGSWYDVPLDALVGAEYRTVTIDGEGGSFLRARLVGSMALSSFSQFLTTPRVANPPVSSTALVVDPNPTGDMKLTVVDCGHGNWNEIETAADRVLYDVGAGRWFTASRVRALVGARAIAAETRSITIVISHWDVDHYHALLEFSDIELTKVRAVFVPSQVPDTETYRRVLNRLTQLNVNVVALPPAAATSGSKKITLERHSNHGAFTVFRATPGRSRNQTGIVLGIRGHKEVALLTGDHHYDKVLAAAIKIPSYGQRPCILVAPHHGGHAGDPQSAAWLGFFSSLTTPISCGSNFYGHPTSDVKKELTAMQCGVTPWRTDVDGTWARVL